MVNTRTLKTRAGAHIEAAFFNQDSALKTESTNTNNRFRKPGAGRKKDNTA